MGCGERGVGDAAPYGWVVGGWVTLLVRAVRGAFGGNHRDGCGFFWYL